MFVEHEDGPLPVVDIPKLYKTDQISFNPSPDLKTISVEVFSIAGNVSTPITQDTHIFYDSETLAVVYRAKSKSAGLASTKVWAWKGKTSQCGEKELAKLRELAKRFGTELVCVFHGLSY